MPTEAVFWKCLQAVAEKVRGLDLGGTEDRVVVQKLPYKLFGTSSTWSPGVFVTPVTETLEPEAGTNRADDPGYRCQVTIVQPSDQEPQENLDRFLLWRERVRGAFHQQRLAEVAESTICLVEPGPVVLPAAYEANYDVQALIVRCVCREIR